MTFLAGQTLTAAALKAATGSGYRCRYVNSGTAETFSAATKLSFPTALQTTPFVVASGTGNTDFTVQSGGAGWWTLTGGGRYGNQNFECYWVIRRGTTDIKGVNMPARVFGVAAVTETLYAAVGDSFNFTAVPSGSITTAQVGEVQSFSMVYVGPD
jgi:hypothetical protein